MRYLNAEDTRAALPMADAIEAMEHAFTGATESPLRSLVGQSLIMPGRLDGLMAVKVVSTVPGNPAGLVVLFEADGSPSGIVDGPTLTAIRTGAASGLATKLLAGESASTLAMLGAGAMAYDQIEAVREVRHIDTVIVWSRDIENARRLGARVAGEVTDDPNSAVSKADVISCATPATEPLFDDFAVKSGAHINAVGAFTPYMVEVPTEVMERAYVVVDDIDAAAAEAGDLIRAGRQPNATLREVLNGTNPVIGEEVTMFKSVGIAAQDVAAASRAIVNAERLGIGVELT